MADVLSSLISTLFFSFRSRLAFQAEILALRHQIVVLKRSSKKRLPLRPIDRILWIWLSRFWCDWRSSLVIVKPETIVRWHRTGFRLFWKWKCSRRGRPSTGKEIRQLIRTAASNSPRRPGLHMLTFARMDLLARTIVFLWALCVLCALAVVF